MKNKKLMAKFDGGEIGIRLSPESEKELKKLQEELDMPFIVGILKYDRDHVSSRAKELGLYELQLNLPKGFEAIGTNNNRIIIRNFDKIYGEGNGKTREEE